MRVLIIIFISLITLQTSNAKMHGDLHERIVKVTEEIKVKTDSAYLYFKRGKLYYQHEDYNNSLVDLLICKDLGLESTELQLQFSYTYSKLGDLDNSNEYANLVLLEYPHHVRALKIIANNYLVSNQYKFAALKFEEVITYSDQSLPENYVNASLAWENFGGEEGLFNAEAVVLKGIKEFGNLISLYSRLKELAINQNNYKKAIAVQEQIIAFIPRKEFSYIELSELQLLNNDPENAIISLSLAKEHIKKLPQRLQKSAFIMELMESIKLKEAKLQNN